MTLTFGPILSRRFGMSLGLDLSPFKKQCNFDCLYCELAPAQTTNTQDSIVSVKELISALKIALSNHTNIDVITLTANGEPTLYPHLEELINEIDKIKGDTKTLILSNGANITETKIQKVLNKIDIVKLSLDCVNKKGFKKLDRAMESIDIDKIVSSMQHFKRQYNGEFIIEVLFVKDINDKDDDITALKTALEKIQPHRIDLGTIDRPPAFDVQPISYEDLATIQTKLNPLPTNITSRNNSDVKPQSFTKEEILQTLKMRPFTQDDIDSLFDNNSQEILKSLVLDGLIVENSIVNVVFYETKIS